MSFLFLCDIHHTDKSRQQSRKHAWVHVPVHSALVTYRNLFCLSEHSEILVLSLIKDALKKHAWMSVSASIFSFTECFLGYRKTVKEPNADKNEP